MSLSQTKCCWLCLLALQQQPFGCVQAGSELNVQPLHMHCFVCWLNRVLHASITGYYVDCCLSPT